jgi:hypothetical protein
MVRFNCVGCTAGDFGSPPAEYLFLKIKFYGNEITNSITDI